MACGKQIVWIEFARVHTLTPIRNATHQRQNVNVPTAKVCTHFLRKRKIIQFNFNAISRKKMLQFKHNNKYYMEV